MGCGKRKENKIDGKGLKQLLGRIFRSRHDDNNNPPFLLVKERTVRVELEQVIEAIIQNPAYDDNQIISLVAVHGLKPSDIEIVRAYIHRFGCDVAKPLPIDAHSTRRLLLDENIPQSAMLSLSQSFGWATHVAAEGLAGRDTPDDDIWEFAYRHGFQAILTRDTDFLEIQKRRVLSTMDGDMSVPLLIFLEENTSNSSLSRMFDHYKTQIENYISKKKYLACSLRDTEGLRPLF